MEFSFHQLEVLRVKLNVSSNAWQQLDWKSKPCEVFWNSHIASIQSGPLTGIKPSYNMTHSAKPTLSLRIDV